MKKINKKKKKSWNISLLTWISDELPMEFGSYNGVMC